MEPGTGPGIASDIGFTVVYTQRQKSRRVGARGLQACGPGSLPTGRQA